jgi:hypothetical protein
MKASNNTHKRAFVLAFPPYFVHITYLFSWKRKNILFDKVYHKFWETFYDVPPTTFLLVPFAHSTCFERDPSLTSLWTV